MGSKNPTSLFNPKILVPTLLTGGTALPYAYGKAEIDKQQKLVEDMKNQGNQAPPKAGPPPTISDPNPDETAAQRIKRVRALAKGFASTLTKKPALQATQIATPTVSPKEALGA